MADYHTVYKGRPGDNVTEWDILQRQYGNRDGSDGEEEKPKADWEPAPLDREEMKRSSAAQTADYKEHNTKMMDAMDTVDDLEELEDDYDDDRFLEEYRQKRMKELMMQGTSSSHAPKQKQGVKHIQGHEFVKEVTEASGGGRWVVCHLYKDGVEDCVILNTCMEELAERYPEMGWVKCVSTSCIPGFDDAFLPTLLIYHDTKCQDQIVNALRVMGGHSTNPDRIALYLRTRYGQNICGSGDGADILHGMVTSLLDDTLSRHQRKTTTRASSTSSFDE
jgi:hypothetical protein